jgi:dolichol-phosphate mannosyltransferase
MNRTLSVVIPVFNNRSSLSELNDSLLEIQEDISCLDIDLQVVYVDDGSIDGSWDELSALQAEYPNFIECVKLSKNFGQLSAMFAGYQYAKNSDAIASIAADLQDPVYLLVEMAKRWVLGSKLIIAERAGRDDSVLWKITSKVAYKVLARDLQNLPTSGFDVFLMDKKVIGILLGQTGRRRFLQGDLLLTGFTPEFIYYRRGERRHGKSQYTLRRRFSYFSDAFFDSSYFLIRITSRLGAISTLLGFLLLVALLYSRVSGNYPFEGYVTTLGVILILGGVQIAILGVISEYIWRIYDTIRQKPMFVIDEITSRKVAKFDE